MKKKLNESKPSEQKNYLNLMGILFIAASAFLVFEYMNDNKDSKKSTTSVEVSQFESGVNSSEGGRIEGSTDLSSIGGSKENSLINKHLWKTTDDIEFQKMLSKANSLKAQKSINEIPKENPSYSSDDQEFFDFDGDPRLRQLTEDMGRANDVKKIKTNDPQSIIYQSVVEQERKSQLTYDKKLEQAKVFIDKAREDGWAVVLDKDFKVKSYQRINKEDNLRRKNSEEAKKFEGYELFPQR